MDIKAFPALIVGVVVALVLAGAVLPVFAETTSATDTFKNEGYYRMTHYKASDDVTIVISWDYTKPNALVVNDVDMDISGPNGMGVSVIIDTNMLLRAGISSNGSVTNLGYFKDNSVSYAEVSHSDTLSITFGSGSYTGTVGNFSVSGTYNDLYVPSKDGYYIMKDQNTPAYMLEDSDIIAYGVTSVNNAGGTGAVKGISIIGNIDEVTLTVWRGSSGFTTTDPVVHSTAVNSYIDLYQLDKITFTGTVTETVDEETVTTNTDVTYSYFLVPYEVTAEKAVHPDGPLTVMLNVLPLLAIAGLVTGAVVWFINRKG